MLRYVLAASALKVFSINSLTKRIYRKIGNTVGERTRLAVDDIDIRIERGELLRQLCQSHQALQDGYRILEIGTGWMHWYSLYLRLFYDIHVTALDIWDNRQFLALQAAARKLSSRFENMSNVDEKARSNLKKVLDCASFDEFYKEFGYEYVIEPNGAMSAFSESQFDFITSFHVLEHVPAQLVAQAVRDMYRTLKPGGYVIHQIGIDDHLTHYDGKASPKQYIKYSDKVWRRFFENEVQYFNRWQTSDWTSVFDDAGFSLVDQIAESASIDDLKVDQRFSDYSRDDLECTILTLVYQKPRS